METGLNRRESFSFGAMSSPNIPGLAKTRQDLPLPDSRIGAFEQSLYGTIIHATLILLAYVKQNMQQKNNNNDNKSGISNNNNRYNKQQL